MRGGRDDVLCRVGKNARINVHLRHLSHLPRPLLLISYQTVTNLLILYQTVTKTKTKKEKSVVLVGMLVKNYNLAKQIAAVATAGLFTKKNGSKICLSCPSGFHQENTTQIKCDLCPAGSTSSKLASISCNLCGKGKYLSEQMRKWFLCR